MARQPDMKPWYALTFKTQFMVWFDHDQRAWHEIMVWFDNGWTAWHETMIWFDLLTPNHGMVWPWMDSMTWNHGMVWPLNIKKWYGLTMADMQPWYGLTSLLHQIMIWFDQLTPNHGMVWPWLASLTWNHLMVLPLHTKSWYGLTMADMKPYHGLTSGHQIMVFISLAGQPDMKALYGLTTQPKIELGVVWPWLKLNYGMVWPPDTKAWYGFTMVGHPDIKSWYGLTTWHQIIVGFDHGWHKTIQWFDLPTPNHGMVWPWLESLTWNQCMVWPPDTKSWYGLTMADMKPWYGLTSQPQILVWFDHGWTTWHETNVWYDHLTPNHGMVWPQRDMKPWYGLTSPHQIMVWFHHG